MRLWESGNHPPIRTRGPHLSSNTDCHLSAKMALALYIITHPFYKIFGCYAPWRAMKDDYLDLLGSDRKSLLNTRVNASQQSPKAESNTLVPPFPPVFGQQYSERVVTLCCTSHFGSSCGTQRFSRFADVSNRVPGLLSPVQPGLCSSILGLAAAQASTVWTAESTRSHSICLRACPAPSPTGLGVVGLQSVGCHDKPTPLASNFKATICVEATHYDKVYEVPLAALPTSK